MILKNFKIKAFNSDELEGNPACVVPLENWLSDDILLKIAKKNNVSETAFFIKKNSKFHLRWFTPDIEMDLCGHATLATAHCIYKHLNFNLKKIFFDSNSGELSVNVINDLYQLDFPKRKPVESELPEEIYNSLNIKPDKVLKSRDYVLVYNNIEDIINIKIDRDIFLKSLAHVQGVVEKKNTLPILGNVLLEAYEGFLKITATDLDIIITEKLTAQTIKEGSTTTTAQVIYDIVRKLKTGSNLHLSLKDNNRLKLISGKSDFNLTCISPDEFPILEDNMDEEYLEVPSFEFLKIINKTKFSISNDETRHYLNGIYLDKNIDNNQMIAVATDGHRLSKSATEIKGIDNFQPIILPKKTVFELLSIIDEDSISIKILSTKSKIKFLYKDIVLISKVIDGKFPDYEKVIPNDERIDAKANVEDFVSALDRLKSLSSDRKGVIKISVDKGLMKFLINDAISGDGIEEVQAQYDGQKMEIGFNSTYLIDVANVLESKEITLMLKDATSPIRVKDEKDPLSTYIVMPMRVI